MFCPFCGYNIKKRTQLTKTFKRRRQCNKCKRIIPDFAVDVALWIQIKNYFHKHDNHFKTTHNIIMDNNLNINGATIYHLFKRNKEEMEFRPKNNKSGEWRLKE